MRLNPGDRLGPYEVLAPLGAGGMGEVYRARDTRLGRDVAVKVLPEHLTANPDVHARFEREARTISSLNHPHICTLHDVGREGDVEYLVMELVEGETLSQRLDRGALPAAELVRLGIQIADALDRAHRAGIVHRDFKPGNVMLTKSGAKLMDFGLARAGGAPGGVAGSGVVVNTLTQSPTVASPLTAEGAIVGTFLYMSPEQLAGRETDARSDLWAFGCVLYEMATGKRAFEGKSQAHLIGAIMHAEPPPLATAAPMLPPQLDALIRACLAKDPDDRIQTAHDVKLQLTWIGQSGSQSGVAAPALPKRRAGREAIAWGVAALAVVAAGFLAWRGRGADRANTGPQVRFSIPVPEGVQPTGMPRISPDGRYLAFAARDSAGRVMVWVRPLNATTTTPLAGTEGANAPFWSPDSRSLAFMAGGKLRKIAIAGGPADVICDAPTGSDGSWSSRGVILFDGADADPIRSVSASGGVPASVVPGDSVVQVGWPAFLPDGRHFFYTELSAKDGNQVMIGTLGQPKGRRLGISGSRVEYSPDGYLLFARQRSLLAQRFDARALKLRGEPFPVAQDMPVGGNAAANFTVSGNGVLVYRPLVTALNRLAWLDRSGHELAEVAGAADYRSPSLSPDGSRIAIRRRELDGTNIDIWIIDPARSTTTRFTFDPGDDGNVLWSPDGQKLVWNSNRLGAGQEGIFSKSASGVGSEDLVARVGTNGAPLCWTPDGGTLLYQAFDTRTGWDLFSVSLSGDHRPQVILQTPYAEQHALLSPDGRWLAYDSNESGRTEVYVAGYQGSAGKWQVSTRGGSDPAWSADGRELFFLSADGQFMSTPIRAGSGFDPGTPAPLFRVQTEVSLRRNVYCVARDAKRFLFLLPVGQNATPMDVMVHWRPEGKEAK